jgi:hypothetical protein
MNETDLWLMAKSQGPSFLLMAIGIWYFWSRDRVNDRKNAENQKRCEDQNDQHTKRINDLTKQIAETNSMLTEIIKDNAVAMKGLISLTEANFGSGAFPAIQNPPNVKTYGSGR